LPRFSKRRLLGFRLIRAVGHLAHMGQVRFFFLLSVTLYLSKIRLLFLHLPRTFTLGFLLRACLAARFPTPEARQCSRCRFVAACSRRMSAATCRIVRCRRWVTIVAKQPARSAVVASDGALPQSCRSGFGCLPCSTVAVIALGSPLARGALVDIPNHTLGGWPAGAPHSSHLTSHLSTDPPTTTWALFAAIVEITPK
jgi:hypothetical protein